MHINKQRMTAEIDGDFVVFLIGMRVNHFWKVHKWLPVALSMVRMLRELYNNPDMGLLHHEMAVGRTIIIVQYWRSFERLSTYAKNADAEHLPMWKRFNQKIASSGDVGICLNRSITICRNSV